LSDFVSEFGDFIPVRDARLIPTGQVLGDVAVNRETIELLREGNGGRNEEITQAKLALARPGEGESGQAEIPAPVAAEPAQRRESQLNRHWLVGVARSAKLAGAEELTLSATQAINEAWSAVVDACRLNDEMLSKLVATHFRLGIADLDKSDSALSSRIPEKIARKYNVLPLREDNGHLVLATSDPTDHDAEQALLFASRKRPIFEMARSRCGSTPATPPTALWSSCSAASKTQSRRCVSSRMPHPNQWVMRTSMQRRSSSSPTWCCAMQFGKEPATSIWNREPTTPQWSACV
jgi:hypothetical protein